MNKSKIVLGILVVVLFWTIGNELINLLDLPIPPIAQSFVVSLFGTGLGAFVAQRNFLIPAFAVWILCWGIAIYILYLIAVPTGQASVIGILQYNAPTIALSALATLIGALVGQLLAQRSQRSAAAI